MENQLDSVTEKPTCFLRLQGLACDWSKHNKHSRNIFSVHGFLRLSVSALFNDPSRSFMVCCAFTKLPETNSFPAYMAKRAGADLLQY